MKYLKPTILLSVACVLAYLFKWDISKLTLCLVVYVLMEVTTKS